MLVFLGLVWSLVLLEEQMREPKWGRGGIFFLAILVGLMVGLGALTRYSFGWLIIPVIVFVAAYAGNRRVALSATVLLSFAVVLSPWLIRNVSVSGTPFGTAGFAIIENSWISPEDRLQRSLNPDLLKPLHNSFPFLMAAWRVFVDKLVSNSRGILQSDLPKLAGTWISAFFLVGLLVRFRTVRLGRLRLF